MKWAEQQHAQCVTPGKLMVGTKQQAKYGVTSSFFHSCKQLQIVRGECVN